MSSLAGRYQVRWVVVAVLVVCAAVARLDAREYRTVEIQSLKITIDSDWAVRLAPGYLPVRFEFVNSGEARVIDVVSQGSRSFRYPGGGIGASSVIQTVRLAKSDHIKITVPVPVYADSESVRFEIWENDKVLERFSYSSYQSRVPSRDASVLIVADPATAFGQVAPQLVRKSGGRVSTVSAMTDFVLEPWRLPTNWISFTSLRAVVIGQLEWQQLNPGQRDALLGWTASGGDLIVVDGTPAAVVADLQGAAMPGPARVVARYLLGRVHAITSTVLADTGLVKVLAAADLLRDNYFVLPVNASPDLGTIGARGFRLIIPGVDGVPARAFLGILILFSLLIGPANYWLLWRKRRQVLLVLTAPIISAAFIVLLTGYALAGEGLSVKGRAQTFTMLDQARKIAVTRATASLYAAGMSPSGGLRFARDTAVFPLGFDGSGTRSRLELNLSEAQRFATGVVAARSPTNFEQVTYRAARERLTFTHDAGGMSVTNGLDATVTALLYREGATVYRLEGSLAPGGRHALPASATGLPSLSGGVSSTNAPAIPTKFVSVFEQLPAGAYVAMLDRSPFWEPGVPTLIESGSLHILFGWPEGVR